MNTLFRTGLWAVLVSGAVALSGCAEGDAMFAADDEVAPAPEMMADEPMPMMAEMEARERAQENAIEAARRAADRAFTMAERNQAAIRALSDKIDRMFADMSRK